jgi:hypothetical protein
VAAPKPWKPWSRVWGGRCDIPATRGRTSRDVARRSGSGRRRRGPAYQGGRCGHPGGASAAHAGLCTAVQAPHSYRADLSQRRELPTAGPSPRGRDARELAVSTSLPQHGQSARAQEGGPAHGGVMLTPSPCGQRCALPTRAHDHRDHDRICRSFWTQLVAPTPTARADRREERARGCAALRRRRFAHLGRLEVSTGPGTVQGNRHMRLCRPSHVGPRIGAVGPRHVAASGRQM